MTTIATPSIQGSWDSPGFLGAGDDQKYLRWDNATGRFVMAAVSLTEAIPLTDLSDVTITTPVAANVLRYSGSAWVNAALDHADLANPASGDAHTQYVLLAGRAGGQTLTGGAGGTEDLTLTSGRNVLSSKNTIVGGVGASRTLSVYTTEGANSIAVVRSSDGIQTAWISQIAGRIVLSNGLYVQNIIQRTGSSAERLVLGGQTGGTDIVCGAAAQVACIIKLAASQTANALEVQNSAGTVQLACGPTGQVKTNQTAVNTNTPSGATARQWPIYDVAGTLLGYVPLYAAAW